MAHVVADERADRSVGRGVRRGGVILRRLEQRRREQVGVLLEVQDGANGLRGQRPLVLVVGPAEPCNCAAQFPLGHPLHIPERIVWIDPEIVPALPGIRKADADIEAIDLRERGRPAGRREPGHIGDMPPECCGNVRDDAVDPRFLRRREVVPRVQLSYGIGQHRLRERVRPLHACTTIAAHAAGGFCEGMRKHVGVVVDCMKAEIVLPRVERPGGHERGGSLHSRGLPRDDDRR